VLFVSGANAARTDEVIAVIARSAARGQAAE
jgi:hypothetical protein